MLRARAQVSMLHEPAPKQLAMWLTCWEVSLPIRPAMPQACSTCTPSSPLCAATKPALTRPSGVHCAAMRWLRGACAAHLHLPATPLAALPACLLQAVIHNPRPLPAYTLQVDHTSAPVSARPAGLGTRRRWAGAGWRHRRPAAAGGGARGVPGHALS